MDLFSYNTANGIIRDRAAQGKAKYVPESGFWENWGEAFRLEFDEHSSVGELLNSGLYMERANKIWEEYSNGRIGREVFQTAVSYQDGMPIVDFNKLALWANDNLGTAYMNDDQIQEMIRDDLKVRREKSSEVFNRANWWGKFGQFAGMTFGVLADPIYLPTYLIGIGAAARGTAWLSRFGRAALAAGSTEASFEAIKQPIVYGWKKELGVDYDFNDAFSQVALAGLGAGVLTGTANEMAIGLRKFLKKNKIYGSKISNEAVKPVENHIREYSRAPDPDMDSAAHMRNLEGEIKYQETRNSVSAEDEVDAVVDEKVYDAETLPEDADREVIVESLETDDDIVTTMGKLDEAVVDLERQAEAARGCIS